MSASADAPPLDPSWTEFGIDEEFLDLLQGKEDPTTGIHPSKRWSLKEVQRLEAIEQRSKKENKELKYHRKNIRIQTERGK